MTGCYPLRVAIDKNRVEIHPHLHVNEITIAEVLRDAGYTCAAFGKWDLAGHSQTEYSPELLPAKQGFDYFFGTPSSNDRSANLIRNEEMIEQKADMSLLSRRYTDEAINFIKRCKGKPFFVYLAHTMPHVRLAVSEPFKGKSAGGFYGDVVEELDFHIGRLLDALQTEGLDDNTYVIFTSDNGPWFLPAGNPTRSGGSAGPLRGAKTSSWEGGLRVPCIMRAPGKIPAGTVSHEISSTLDMLQTLAALAGGKMPDDRVIDGHDIRNLIHGVPKAKSPTQVYYYYVRTRLHAVRAGRWKLHLPLPVDEKWKKYSQNEDVMNFETPVLFDLEKDIGEKNNVANKHPEVVKSLLELAEQGRNDIGDHDRIGQNARFFDPQPRRPDIN